MAATAGHPVRLVLTDAAATPGDRLIVRLHSGELWRKRPSSVSVRIRTLPSMADVFVYDWHWPLRYELTEDFERRLDDVGLRVMRDYEDLPFSLEPNVTGVPTDAIGLLAEVAPLSEENAYMVWWPSQNDIEMHVTTVVGGQLHEIRTERPRARASELEAAVRWAENRALDERIRRVAELTTFDPALRSQAALPRAADLVAAMPADWSDDQRWARMVDLYEQLRDAYLHLRASSVLTEGERGGGAGAV